MIKIDIFLQTIFLYGCAGVGLMSCCSVCFHLQSCFLCDKGTWHQCDPSGVYTEVKVSRDRPVVASAKPHPWPPHAGQTLQRQTETILVHLNVPFNILKNIKRQLYECVTEVVLYLQDNAICVDCLTSAVASPHCCCYEGWGSDQRLTASSERAGSHSSSKTFSSESCCSCCKESRCGGSTWGSSQSLQSNAAEAAEPAAPARWCQQQAGGWWWCVWQRSGTDPWSRSRTPHRSPQAAPGTDSAADACAVSPSRRSYWTELQTEEGSVTIATSMTPNPNIACFLTSTFKVKIHFRPSVCSFLGLESASLLHMQV